MRTGQSAGRAVCAFALLAPAADLPAPSIACGCVPRERSRVDASVLWVSPLGDRLLAVCSLRLRAGLSAPLPRRSQALRCALSGVCLRRRVWCLCCLVFIVPGRVSVEHAPRGLPPVKRGHRPPLRPSRRPRTARLSSAALRFAVPRVFPAFAGARVLVETLSGGFPRPAAQQAPGPRPAGLGRHRQFGRAQSSRLTFASFLPSEVCSAAVLFPWLCFPTRGSNSSSFVSDIFPFPSLEACRSFPVRPRLGVLCRRARRFPSPRALPAWGAFGIPVLKGVPCCVPVCPLGSPVDQNAALLDTFCRWLLLFLQHSSLFSSSLMRFSGDAFNWT